MTIQYEYVDKFRLADFLNKLAGGEDEYLALATLRQHKQAIMSMINAVRKQYEGRPDESSAKKYYEECWRAMDEAFDDRDLLYAIQHLRSSIKWE